MTLPKFTAEASLYTTSGHHLLNRNSNDRKMTNAIHLAMMKDETIEVHGCAPGSVLVDDGDDWYCISDTSPTGDGGQGGGGMGFRGPSEPRGPRGGRPGGAPRPQPAPATRKCGPANPLRSEWYKRVGACFADATLDQNCYKSCLTQHKCADPYKCPGCPIESYLTQRLDPLVADRCMADVDALFSSRPDWCIMPQLEVAQYLIDWQFHRSELFPNLRYCV